MKKLLLFLFISFSVTLVAQDRIFLPDGINLAQVQAQNTIIAWDIHQVLAKRDWPLFYTEYAKAMPVFIVAAAKYMIEKASCIYTGIPGKYQQALQAIRSLEHGVSGQSYMDVFVQYGCSEMVDPIIRLSNSYYPDKHVEEIVMKLDALGVEQCVASNIGDTMILHMADYFNKLGSAIFSILKKGVVVGTGALSLTDQNNQGYISCSVSKPNSSFFSTLKQAYNPHNEKQLIFIDDSLDNVKAAQSLGIIGIWYQKKDTNAPEYLKQDLAELSLAIE